MMLLTAIPLLETRHYTLRGIQKEDASELIKFLGDKETMKFITSDPVQSEHKVKEEIGHQLSRFLKQKEIPWVIIDKNNGDVVGTFRLYKLHVWHKKADMGVVIRKAYQNNGVMTEVMQEILRFSFDQLGLNRIVGDIFASNRGSEKLLERYGFKKEGVLRQTDFDGERYHDTVVYSLLKAEYDAQRTDSLHLGEKHNRMSD